MRRFIAWLLVCVASLSFSAVAPTACAQDEFRAQIQPLLKEFCLGCHSTKEMKGEVDLERFATVRQVKEHPEVWQSMLEQFANNEMPPKDKPQLSVDQKAKLTNWAKRTLDEIALASAGDPGPVVLRRLSNFEYGYAIRDLTGVDSLDPAREFPVDGAAGEGFTNAGAALVMSPALLTKYLDAAKEIAQHAVLTPDGIRFSPYTTQRDWTDETLAKIRSLYASYSATGGGTSVNLQGIKFDTNAGGRLPLEKVLAALLTERDALRANRTSLRDVASQHAVNEKYLGLLWNALNDRRPSLVLDGIRDQFNSAAPQDAAALANLIGQWQQSLWRFASVGHIGKKNGPKCWLEAVTPLVARNETRLKLTPPADGSDVVVYFSAGDAGDGNEHDFAVWENPRLAAPGRPDMPLRDLNAAYQRLADLRTAVIASTEKCLAAAADAKQEMEAGVERSAVAALATKHQVDPDLLAAWFHYLGLGTGAAAKIGPPITGKAEQVGGYNFVKGWTGTEALSVLANSSDASVRIPGLMKPNSIAAHPSPRMAVALAWRSPIDGSLKIQGSIQDAHPECGNGVTWSLELRASARQQVLASGVSKGNAVVDFRTHEKTTVRAGDLIAVVIGPRDANHSCDLTAVDLEITDGKKTWNLAKETSDNLLAGNPHADRHGNADVWYFFSEPESAASQSGNKSIPVGSWVSLWLAATNHSDRQRFATELQQLLERGTADLLPVSPNVALYKQLTSFTGPLLSAALKNAKLVAPPTPSPAGPSTQAPTNRAAPTTARVTYGLDPALFGKHPRGARGGDVTASDVCVHAPMVLEVRIPAVLTEGAELVVGARLHAQAGGDASAQLQVLTTKPEAVRGLAVSKAEVTTAPGRWSDNNLRTAHNAPVLVADGGEARRRIEAAFDDFRQLFPAALCYTKIVPVDEVVTLTIFYREDDHLRRLMLNDQQTATLDRLWDELLFVAEAPLKNVDVLEQLYQFATQDADPSVFAPLREPYQKAAEEFQRRRLAVEPLHVQAALDVATRAWRRPLTDTERQQLGGLYQSLRKQELPHAEAVRMLIARVLVAPAFLYRGELAVPGAKPAPVSDWELATRLSFFLWSSSPDDELRALAAAGKMRDPGVLASQIRRMTKDPKVRRLANEFGCQWLHVRDLETLDEKSEQHFPTFAAVRGAMQEEAVRFFVDLFQEDRSVLSLLDADHTFVNGELAKHYGLKINGSDWQRVDGLRAAGRGGMLGFASTLAKQSGASRTSPILRGNWLSEVVLGEKLPKPPKGVPVLPDETPAGLTERQLIERHSSDVRCASCHKRIDPFGFALEGFDAIGRSRTKDAAGQPIDSRVTLPDGTQLAGLDGLRNYLATTRRDDFLRQFCRKLLGYSLGRAVQLSDQPLVEEMVTRLKTNDYRVSVAIERIVLSAQFGQVRGTGRE